MFRIVSTMTLIASLFCVACGDDPLSSEPELALQVRGHVYDTSGGPVYNASIALFMGSYWSGDGVSQAHTTTSPDGFYTIRLNWVCDNPRMTVRVPEDGAMGFREVNTADNPAAFSRPLTCTSDIQEVDVTI